MKIENELEEINNRFNAELELFLKGDLKKGHVFKLGLPGQILRDTSFPPEHEIELTAEQLKKKANSRKHSFDPALLVNLVNKINQPLAVFSYGEKNKAQNVIIDIQQNEKYFLIGVHLQKEKLDTFITDIRTIFPKDTEKWLNWINQGKLLYTDIKKLQVVVNHLQPIAVDMIQHTLKHQTPVEETQRQTISAEVSNPNPELI